MSGRVITKTSGIPSIYDTILALSRVPRFAGNTHGEWTVLQHSLVAHSFAVARGLSPRVKLFALLHDAHEAVTGDVPTPWKSPELNAFQDDLDRRLWAELSVRAPSENEQALIDGIDRDALYAEASSYSPAIADYAHWPMPPWADSRIVLRYGAISPFHCRGLFEDALRGLLEELGIPEWVVEQAFGVAVVQVH